MTQTVRFAHNTKNPKLRYTVAYSFNKSADGTLDVTYGIAQYNKVDSFSRAVGRELATGRFNKAAKGKTAPTHGTNGIFTFPIVQMYGRLSVKGRCSLALCSLVEAASSEFTANSAGE
jgi:hypothetical protein